MRAFDETRNVGQHKAPAVRKANDAKVWLSRCERVVSDLGPCGGYTAEQRRLPGVGESSQAGIGDQPQFELEPAFLPRHAGLCLPRSAVRGRRNPRVTPPSPAAPRHDDRLPMMEQISQDLPALPVPDHRADRHGNDQGSPPPAVASASFPVAAALRAVVLAVLKIQQRREALIGHQRDVATVSAVAPIRSALGHKLLATKTYAAIAAVAASDIDPCLVNEHCAWKTVEGWRVGRWQ